MGRIVWISLSVYGRAEGVVGPPVVGKQEWLGNKGDSGGKGCAELVLCCQSVQFYGGTRSGGPCSWYLNAHWVGRGETSTHRLRSLRSTCGSHLIQSKGSRLLHTVPSLPAKTSACAPIHPWRVWASLVWYVGTVLIRRQQPMCQLLACPASRYMWASIIPRHDDTH